MWPKVVSSSMNIVTQSWDYPTKSWWTHQPILQPKVEHSFCNIVNKVFNKNQNSTINIVTQSWDYPSKSQTLILRYRNKSCEIIRVKNQSSTTISRLGVERPSTDIASEVFNMMIKSCKFIRQYDKLKLRSFESKSNTHQPIWWPKSNTHSAILQIKCPPKFEVQQQILQLKVEHSSTNMMTQSQTLILLYRE